MNISSKRTNFPWMEIVVQDGSARIDYDLPYHELQSFKDSLLDVIEDIDIDLEEIKNQEITQEKAI